MIDNNSLIKNLILEAIRYQKENNINIALKKYKEVLKLDPYNIQSHNNLGLIYKNQGDYKKSIICFEDAIKINPVYQNAINNIAIVFFEIGEYSKAIKRLKKLININPSLYSVYCNLGLCYEKVENSQKAIDIYKLVPKTDKNFLNAQYNLGIVFYKIKKYKNVKKIFKSINFKKSKSYYLKCLYKLNDKINLSKELDNEIKKKTVNAFIGSIVSLSKIKFGINKKNLFCENPLNFTKIINLNDQHDFNQIFVKTFEQILENKDFQNKPQPLLVNGIQSASNIFFYENNNIKKIKKIIHDEVENYLQLFKNYDCGLFKNWPKEYYLDGWIVKMKSGGNIKPHIHEHGWLSGSIYINVPSKNEPNSGNLVVSLNDETLRTEYNKTNYISKIIDVQTGSLCLFPASLFHYTIPFNSTKDRVVLAFDVIPK